MYKVIKEDTVDGERDNGWMGLCGWGDHKEEGARLSGKVEDQSR